MSDARTRLLRLLVRWRAVPADVAERIAPYGEMVLPLALARAMIMDEEQLADLLAERAACKRMRDLPAHVSNAEALLSLATCEQHGVVPLVAPRAARTALVVALWDPTDPLVLDRLRFAAGAPLEIMVASYGDIVRALAARRAREHPPAPTWGVPAQRDPADVVDEPPPSAVAALLSDAPVTDDEGELVVLHTNAVLLHAGRTASRVLITPTHTRALQLERARAYVDLAGPPTAPRDAVIRRLCVMGEVSLTAGIRSGVVLRVQERYLAFRFRVERTNTGFACVVHGQRGDPLADERGVSSAWAGAHAAAQRAPPPARLAAWQRVIALAEEDGRASLLANALADEATSLLPVDTPATTARALAAAARHAELHDRPAHTAWVRASGHLVVARVALHAGRAHEALARARFEQALAILSGDDGAVDRAHVRSELAAWHGARADAAAAARELAAWRAEDMELFDAPTTSSVRALAEHAAVSDGPEVRDVVEEALRRAEEVGAKQDLPWQRDILRVLVDPMRRHGMLAQGEQGARLLLAAATTPLDRAAAHHRLARVLIDAGRTDAAARELALGDRALAHEKAVMPATRAYATLTRARLLEAHGKRDEARAAYARALAVVRSPEAELRASALA